MALVAGAVANGGTIMEPHLLKKVTGPKGGTVVKIKPHVWRHAMKPESAALDQGHQQGAAATGKALALRQGLPGWSPGTPHP